MVFIRSFRVFFLGGVKSGLANSHVFGVQKGTLSSAVLCCDHQWSSEKGAQVLCFSPVLPSACSHPKWKRAHPSYLISAHGRGYFPQRWHYWRSLKVQQSHLESFFSDSILALFFSSPTLCPALLPWSEKPKQSKGCGNSWMNFWEKSLMLMRRRQVKCHKIKAIQRVTAFWVLPYKSNMACHCPQARSSWPLLPLLRRAVAEGPGQLD